MNARTRDGISRACGYRMETGWGSVSYFCNTGKYIISDGLHVQTGSFNYSQAAANANSENVLVVWHNAALAALCLKHWQSRYEEGQDYRPGY